MNGGFAQTNSFLVSRDFADESGLRSSVLQHEDICSFSNQEHLGPGTDWSQSPSRSGIMIRRTDRMGLEAHFERSRHYLDEAGGLITEKARLAFEVRLSWTPNIERCPLGAMKLFRRASTNHAVLRRHLLAVWFALPPSGSSRGGPSASALRCNQLIILLL